MSRKSSTARVDLKKLDALADEDIDYSEIPELGDDFFANAKRMTPVKPIKKAISVRLDQDVLEWLKAGGKGYQSRINGILRAVMASSARRTTRAVGKPIRQATPRHRLAAAAKRSTKTTAR